jgi:DNA-binding LytR/AlgR family response regulator
MGNDMRIAVCDDDLGDRQHLGAFIERFDADLAVAFYASAEDLLAALATEYYEMIFLDIEMEGLDGFNAAKIITGNEDSPLIVFVTKSSKYTIQGYEVAFRYLVKPVAYDDFTRVMKAALDSLAPRKIALEFNGKNYVVPTKDISYIEILNHNIRVHLENNVFECRNSLKNLEDVLTGSPFVRPHNSFIVNLDHVTSMSQTEIVMKDQTKISISRKKKDDVFKAFHQFLRR